MKLYCTKYATTEGILEFNGKIENDVLGHWRCHNMGHGNCALNLKPGEFFETLESAQKDALDRLTKAVEKAGRTLVKAQRKLAQATEAQGVRVLRWEPQQGTVKS